MAFASCALFPCALRWGRAEAARSNSLSQRQALLERALSNRTLENRDLATELRRLKDSTLAAIDAWRSTPRPPRAVMTGLLFDSRLPASFDNGDRRLKTVALTFDADAHANAAEEILDTLASRGVHATIFLGGQFILRHPELVRKIVAQGHDVGNHLYSHPHLTSWEQDGLSTTLPSVSRATLFAELGRTERAFGTVTGREMPPIWRAPYGERNRQVCVWGQEAGYLHVGWRQGRTWRQGLDSNDWVPDENDPRYHSPEEVLRKIIEAAQQQPAGISGGIILMHLGTLRPRRSQQVHLVLGRLIDHLRGLGYEFVTVTRMAQESGVDLTLLRRTDQAVSQAATPQK